MRYPDGGGLSAQGRVRREAVRLQAAGWFAEGVSVPEVARRLRVSQTAVHGFGEDQRWTLARVSDLIARMFRTRYTLRGTSYLLHRIGWSVQVPKHRPVERVEAAVATWRREVWPAGKR